MQNLTLIKLGGSIITEKSKPSTLRPDVLQRLVTEIATASATTTDHCIIGHGQGSFAHFPAKKYGTKQGFTHAESRKGMGLTQNSVLQSNQLVVAACIAAGLPAFSYLLSSAAVTQGDKLLHWDASVLKAVLAQEMVPVTCGDVLVDTTQGCTIWSTEKILGLIAERASEVLGYTVSRIIHVTDVPGVLDEKKRVISEITPANFETVKKLLYGVNGADVTGGMLHKIEESLLQAARGTEVRIVSGLEPGVLHAALAGETVGTVITGG